MAISDDSRSSTAGGPVSDGVSPARTQPGAPVVALRTYRFLRLSVLGLLTLLAVSVLREYRAAGGCWQGSISAYYFTPVQSVFVGTLVALGVVMIVLWGKTVVEDSLFNLAGMLTPIVAFVPTLDTNRCGLRDAAGGLVTSRPEADSVIEGHTPAVVNNVSSYYTVLFVALLAIGVVGVVAHLWTRWAPVVEHATSYWLAWGAATALWTWGVWSFTRDRDDFLDGAHNASAIVMFVLVIAAIFAIGAHRLREDAHAGDAPERRWGIAYLSLGSAMVVGCLALWGLNAPVGDDSRLVLQLEVWLLAGFFVFWTLQTVDRWNEGAPPRTSAEVERGVGAP